jgi:hypothetical protein
MLVAVDSYAGSVLLPDTAANLAVQLKPLDPSVTVSGIDPLNIPAIVSTASGPGCGRPIRISRRTSLNWSSPATAL